MKNRNYLKDSSATQTKVMKASIMYVEDDETLSFVTKDNLEIQGYGISHFANGLNAKDEILTNLGNYDLCILDVMLPEIDGFALAELIRERNSQIPILFLTAKSLKDVILENVWGEDDYFLGRSLDVFISRLRKYLSKDNNLKIKNIHGVGFIFETKV